MTSPYIHNYNDPTKRIRLLPVLNARMCRSTGTIAMYGLAALTPLTHSTSSASPFFDSLHAYTPQNANQPLPPPPPPPHLVVGVLPRLVEHVPRQRHHTPRHIRRLLGVSRLLRSGRHGHNVRSRGSCLLLLQRRPYRRRRHERIAVVGQQQQERGEVNTFVVRPAHTHAYYGFWLTGVFVMTGGSWPCCWRTLRNQHHTSSAGRRNSSFGWPHATKLSATPAQAHGNPAVSPSVGSTKIALTRSSRKESSMCVCGTHTYLNICAFERPASAHADPLSPSHLVPTNAAPEASANATFIIA